MADPNHLIPGLFRIVEDVIGKSVEVISDAERRGDRSLPSHVAKDSRPLTLVGSTPDPEFKVKIALNAETKDWETFVQSILGRATLPSWE